MLASPIPLAASSSSSEQSYSRQPLAIIFDLGDVVFNWTADPLSPIPRETVRAIMTSPIWAEYERGKLAESECYAAVASAFAVSVDDLVSFAAHARASMRFDPAMLGLLRTLRARGDVRVFAMSNISRPDWEYLSKIGRREDWDLFDRIFISAAAGQRKPDAAFYEHVVSAGGIDPRRTVFIDDKLKNVSAARVLGMTGIVFAGAEDLSRELGRLLPDLTAPPAVAASAPNTLSWIFRTHAQDLKLQQLLRWMFGMGFYVSIDTLLHLIPGAGATEQIVEQDP